MIMWWKRPLGLAAILLLLGATIVHSHKDYKNYKVYDVYAESEDHLVELRQLQLENKNYDFLNQARRLNDLSKVLVPPQLAEEFTHTMQKHSFNFTRVVDDVSQVIAQERKVNSHETATEYPLNVVERYYRHDEINQHLEVLAKMFPSRVFVKTFGKTYENRPINVFTITNGDGRSGKKVVFVDAGMHAREWIAPAMALHIINELTLNFKNNTAFLEDYDWVILPVVNADGYEYTHDVSRYWRKTRRPTSVEDCIGTDPNRNFDHVWGWEEGASPDPCDETYHGEKAFSEPETQVVRDIMHHYGERLIWYLTLHSYGNYILLPWGHPSDLPVNYFDIMEVADAFAMTIVFTTGGLYTYGNTYNFMYPTSGDSADYAAAMGVTIPICIELPAGGFMGFDPPVRQIEGFVEETWIGIRAMAEIVTEKY